MFHSFWFCEFDKIIFMNGPSLFPVLPEKTFCVLGKFLKPVNPLFDKLRKLFVTRRKSQVFKAQKQILGCIGNPDLPSFRKSYKNSF